ncbi:MAG: HD domain-containing protein [Desulfuromonadales bacterium]|nr:HD domain-containing protein [Desulfuromonadales bacterium]MBN2791052.1 HD domain-containing protein [Desulfuromonadales bacterium]
MSQHDKHLQLFIRQITTAAANAALYQLEHPQVLNLCRQALDQLKILFSQTPEITFKIIENRLIFADHPVTSNLSVERFVEALKALKISFIQISPGLTTEELLILAGHLSKRTAQHQNLRKTENIRYGQVEVRYRDPASGPEKSSVLADFSAISEKDRDKFMDIYQGVSRKKQLNVLGITEIVADFVSTFETHSNILLALAPLRSMDEYAYTHSTNICLLNLAQAKLLGIEGPLLNEIGVAAMLHDVGKMFISPDILNKPGKLDPDEWKMMQQHPQLGAEYLLNAPGIPRLAVVTAYEHHIGYDGRGYPATPRSWPLNTCSYMTSISDVYDALRTRRSYKEPLTFDQISTIMLESAGKSLHPDLTRSFLKALAELESPSH